MPRERCVPNELNLTVVEQSEAGNGHPSPGRFLWRLRVRWLSESQRLPRVRSMDMWGRAVCLK